MNNQEKKTGVTVLWQPWQNTKKVVRIDLMLDNEEF